MPQGRRSQRPYNVRYYVLHREREIARGKAETTPWVETQFDHRNPATKSFELVHMAGRRTLVALLEELAKCDIVRCSRHRDRTTHRRSNTRE